MTTKPSNRPPFTCPICLDQIRGAFVTKCGHSFCFTCISQHTKGQTTLCPVCRTQLGEGDLFPNYALEELARSADTQNTQASTCGPSKPLGSILFIRQRIAELLDQKVQLEKGTETADAEVTLEFLRKLHKKKIEILETAKTEITQIEQDMMQIQTKILSAREPTSSLSSEEGDSVPSLSLQEEICIPSKRSHVEGPRLTRATPISIDTPIALATPIEQSRKVKMEAFFPELESIYRECRLMEDAELDTFSRKLGQVTGQNIYHEVASISLPESLGSSNIISSIDFDFSGQIFASAGVAKRIKIFNFDQMEASNWTNTFPNQEIYARSKISALSWNPYIQNQLAAVDYDGLLSIYDSATGQAVARFEEHDRRAWSVDYSRIDPTRLATGSDDHRVKIWSLNTRGSVCTIDGKANICAVQFSPETPNIIAFGSADHNVHLYDLRYPTRSTQVLQGHKKAVSYVRFMSNHEIVSASTDCTLRLWDVRDQSDAKLPGQPSIKPDCRRIYTGHLNEKNFVGLSISGDLISCGSESNIVYAYHRDLSQPLSSFRFTNYSPRNGEELETETSGFISALCWRPDRNCLVAANSQGIIKVLQLTE